MAKTVCVVLVAALSLGSVAALTPRDAIGEYELLSAIPPNICDFPLTVESVVESNEEFLTRPSEFLVKRARCSAATDDLTAWIPDEDLLPANSSNAPEDVAFVRDKLLETPLIGNAVQSFVDTGEDGFFAYFDETARQCSDITVPRGTFTIQFRPATEIEIAGVKFLAGDDYLLLTLPNFNVSTSSLTSRQTITDNFNVCAFVKTSSTLGPLPTPPPTPTPEPTSAPCFPSHARVELRSGALVPLRALTAGARVHVGGGEYSRVVTFGHRSATQRAAYLRVETAAAALEISPNHYMYANGAMVAAREVRVGDVVRLARGGGADAVVRSVVEVVRAGLYSPITEHGDVVVDGVVVSSYTTAVDPRVARVMLWPYKVVSGWWGMRDVLGEWMAEESRVGLARSVGLARGPAVLA